MQAFQGYNPDVADKMYNEEIDIEEEEPMLNHELVQVKNARYDTL